MTIDFVKIHKTELRKVRRDQIRKKEKKHGYSNVDEPNGDLILVREKDFSFLFLNCLKFNQGVANIRKIYFPPEENEWRSRGCTYVRTYVCIHSGKMTLFFLLIRFNFHRNNSLRLRIYFENYRGLVSLHNTTADGFT